MLLTIYLTSLISTKTVSLTLDATRMERLATVLSPLVGYKLEVDSGIKDEVLAVAVKEVAPRELLDRVASACSATWVKQRNGELLLSRPRSVSDAQKQEWISERLKQLEAMTGTFRKIALQKPEIMSTGEIDGLLGALAESNPTSPITEPGQLAARASLHDRLVGGRLLARLMTEIDLRPIAESSATDRVVFSSKKTQLQVALGSGSGKALGDFAVEQRVLASRIRSFEKPPIDFSEVGGVPSYYTEPLPDEPLDARLIVRGRGDRWELSLFSPQGNLMFRYEKWLQAPRVPPVIDPSLQQWSKIEVTVDPEGQAFRASTAGSWKAGVLELTPAQGALREKLLRPNEVDPLSFIAGPAILQLAELTGANYVGTLPDNFINGGRQLGNLIGAGAFRLEQGWLIGRPSTYGDRARRMARSVLRQFLAEVGVSGAESLRAKAILAEAGIAPTGGSVSDARGQLATMLARALGAPTTPSASDQIGLNILMGLSSLQLQTLLEGSAIRFTDLPNGTRTEVSRLFAKGAFASLQPVNQGLIAPSKVHLWQEEPTQIWSNGVPSEARVRVVQRSIPVVMDIDAPARVVVRPEEIAMFLHTPASQSSTQFRTEHALTLGAEEVFDVALVTDGSAWSTTIKGFKFAGTSTPVRFEKLPQSFQEEVQTIRSRLGGGVADEPKKTHF